MKINELIETYQKEVDLKTSSAAVQKSAAISKSEIQFGTLALEYLGDIREELNAGEITHFFSNSGFSNQVTFQFAISYLGREGRVYQGKNNLYTDAWDYMHLDFGHLHGENGSSTVSIRLPATPTELGEIFATVRERLDYQKRRAAEIREGNLPQAFDFAGYGEEGVTRKLQNALSEYPEHREAIEAAATARRDELAKEKELRLIEQLAYELEKSEREQLGLLAEFAWRGPFEVNKVIYGAKMVSEEDGETVYTAEFYTLMTEDEAYMPHNRGYWTAFESGQYTRRIKPAHMISIEKIKIDSIADAPHDLRRWTSLESKALKDVSIATHLPPFELFAFDYDALKVAVEAEQESETPDATQEENS